MGSKSEETPKFASKAGSAPFSPSPVNQKGASMGAFSPAPKPVAPTPIVQDEGDDGKRQSRFAGFLNALQGKAKPDGVPDKKPDSGFIPFTGNLGSSQPMPFTPSTKSGLPSSPKAANPFANTASSIKVQPNPVADESKNQLTCPNCGSVLNKAFKFCNKCGFRVQ